MTTEMLREDLDAIARDWAAPSALGRADRAMRISHRRRTRRLVGGPVVAAVAVAVAVFGGMSLVGHAGPDYVHPAVGPGSIPDQIFPAGEVPWVSSHPLGRASLIYRGPGGNNTLYAVGADGDTYRRLITGASDTVYALSPDGTRVAYGPKADASTAPDRGAIKVLDLRSGRTTSYPLPPSRYGEQLNSIVWSPDGSLLAYDAVRVDEVGAKGWKRASEAPGVIDLGTRTVAPLPARLGAPVAWSEDGKQLLLSGYEGEKLIVTDATGRILRTVTASGAFADPFHASAWSPDGTIAASVVRLATPDEPASSFTTGKSHPYEVRFLSLATGGRASGAGVVRTVLAVDVDVVGWRNSGQLVLDETLADGSAQVVSIDVASRASTVLVRAAADARAWKLDIASDVLAGGQIRHAAPPS